MKKFWSLILCFMYIISSNACFAFSELYYLKNVDNKTISNQVETVLNEEEYNIQKKNPFYAISKKKQENYAVVVLQQSGKNLFYYYESNDKNKKLNKKIIKTFKKADIVYEQSENEQHLNNFAQIAYRTMTGQKKVYSFEEPKKQQTSVKAAQKNTTSTTLKGFVGKIDAGTKLNVYLQNPINTATAKKGDNVIAVVKNDWIYKECTVAPQGSLLYGTLTKANHATAGSRNGSVSIVFNKLVTPKNKTIEISTEKIDFDVTNEGKVKRTITNTVAMAAVGALLGVGIAALTGDSSNLAQGAIIGASIGGGGALATSAIQKGVDAEIPSYTDMEVVLNKPVNVVLSY